MYAYKTYDDLVRSMAESEREFDSEFIEKAYLLGRFGAIPFIKGE